MAEGVQSSKRSRDLQIKLGHLSFNPAKTCEEVPCLGMQRGRGEKQRNRCCKQSQTVQFSKVFSGAARASRMH